MFATITIIIFLVKLLLLMDGVEAQVRVEFDVANHNQGRLIAMCASSSGLTPPPGEHPMSRTATSATNALDQAYDTHPGSCEVYLVEDASDTLGDFASPNMDLFVCAIKIGFYVECNNPDVLLAWGSIPIWPAVVHAGRVVKAHKSGEIYTYRDVKYDATATPLGVYAPQNVACNIGTSSAVCCNGDNPDTCVVADPTQTPVASPTPVPVTGPTPVPVMTPSLNTGGNPTPTTNGDEPPSEPDSINIILNELEANEPACDSGCIAGVVTAFVTLLIGILGYLKKRHDDNNKNVSAGDGTETAVSNKDVPFGGPMRNIWLKQENKSGSATNVTTQDDETTIGFSSVTSPTTPSKKKKKNKKSIKATDSASFDVLTATNEVDSDIPTTPSKKKKKKKSSRAIDTASSDALASKNEVDGDTPVISPSPSKKKKKKSITLPSEDNSMFKTLTEMSAEGEAQSSASSIKKIKKKKSTSTILAGDEISTANDKESKPKKKRKSKRNASASEDIA